MSYLFEEDTEKELGGEFACFACYEATDRATVDTKSGILSYECPNGHVTELPWGEQLEVDDE